jgi:glyoxylase-like metal-dependent hydrolase (beta-lactamase superfamily II)
MTGRNLAAALLTAALLPPTGQAQSVSELLDAAAKAMGTAQLHSLRYTGTGTNNSLGQAFTAGGPWPQFTVKQYVALVDYAEPAMRQEIVRIDDQRPPRGGGAGPFNPATGQGGIRPIPGDIIQNSNADGRTEAGALSIWLTPHGFIKGAIASGNATMTARGKSSLVSFTAFGKYTITGTLDERRLVTRVATVIDGGLTGDTPLEASYTDYADFGGVELPRHIVQRQGGYPVLDIAVATAEPNAAAARELRAGGSGSTAAAAGAPTIKAEKIADGVWFLTLGSPQSLLVEFKDYVVIIEGPTGDARSLATIAAARQMFPSKPIRYLVNSHHHADHAGGIRAYVAEGIPIITHQSHKRYYERVIFANPHTLNPDRLARMPRAPILETMNDKRVLTDGSMTLELHLMRGNLHSEGLLMAYVPQAKLLIQADAFAPRPGAAPLPERSPYTTNLIDNVERLKLDVERVAHIHGGVDPWSKVLEADGRVPPVGR